MPVSTGLFGGTFDPVHNGHLSIAQSFLDSGLIDELWLLLTPHPPHKERGSYAAYGKRYRMLQEAFRDINGIMISAVENELPKPSYSFRTIRHLKEEFPSHTFYFCMGEDSLSEFHTWKYYQKILEECELLVARRPGEDHKNVKDEILNKTHFVDHEPLAISSSEIRQKIKAGKNVRQLLPNSVLSIIEKENLYT